MVNKLYSEIEQSLDDKVTIDNLIKRIKMIDRLVSSEEYDKLTREYKEDLNDWNYDAWNSLEMLIDADNYNDRR